MKKLLSILALVAMLSLASCGKTQEVVVEETPVENSNEVMVETPVEEVAPVMEESIVEEVSPVTEETASTGTTEEIMVENSEASAE